MAADEMAMALRALSLRSGPDDPPASGDPDASLVEAARRDPAQFLALYDRYFPRIHGYVRLRVRDVATCEDVTSHVFMTALAKIDTFRRGGSFSAWLFRIAQNAVNDVYRGWHADSVGVHARVLDNADEVIQALPDCGPGPEEWALAEERRVQLRALVGTLRPEQQHLLALRYGAGLSFDEIGRAVGKSAVAVRVGVHRALGELRRRYPHDD